MAKSGVLLLLFYANLLSDKKIKGRFTTSLNQSKP